MKFLVLGYYGFFNSGDDAILHAVCQDIATQNPDNIITVMSNDPVSTAEEYCCSAIYRYNMVAVINEIKQSDVVVFGGGSLLQDVTSSKSLYYYLTVMRIAQKLKKKTILYANGVGPINNIKNQKSTAKVLNKMTKITVRDAESAKFLYGIGVKANKVELTADPVYNIEFEKCDINEIFKEHNLDLKGKEFVTVYCRQFGDDDKYTKNVAEVLDEVYDKFGLSALFVPMEHPSDFKVSWKIQNQMKRKSYIFTNRVKVDDMFEIIDNSKLVLGMRLHSLIYASVQNTPMIALSYDPKVDSFAKQMGVKCFEYNNFDVNLVVEEVENILDNYDTVKEELNKNYLVNKEKAQQNVKALDELVKG